MHYIWTMVRTELSRVPYHVVHQNLWYQIKLNKKKQYSTVIGETKKYFTMYTSSAKH